MQTLFGVCSLRLGFSYLSPLGTSLGSDGKNSLLVWPGPGSLSAVSSTNGCGWTTPLLVDYLPPQVNSIGFGNPQIAGDSTRFLIVYQVSTAGGGFEIRGAAVTGDRITAPFVVAAGRVRRPAVITAAGGRFLVAYEVLSADGTQLAGRFIAFPEPRRRVVK